MAAMGHILSPKSKDLGRDTFFFITLSQKSQLFLGVNQKFTPISSATIHRWVELMNTHFESEEFFLCPVIMRKRAFSAGGITISKRRNRLKGDIVEALQVLKSLIKVKDMLYAPTLMVIEDDNDPVVKDDAEGARLKDQPNYPGELVVDAASPKASVVMARDKHRCRFAGTVTDTILAWIIPPMISGETDNFCNSQFWENTPFLVFANVITMHTQLRFHFYNNHFTVDVDDDYRILVLRSMGDVQALLPTHLPYHAQQYAAANGFLRHRCRDSLNLMLRGGDIKEVYPNSVILCMMHELGVDYNGNENRHELDVAPLSDARWQTELGQAVMAEMLRGRIAQSLYESGGSTSGSSIKDSPNEDPESASFEQSSSSSDFANAKDTQKSPEFPPSSLNRGDKEVLGSWGDYVSTPAMSCSLRFRLTLRRTAPAKCLTRISRDTGVTRVYPVFFERGQTVLPEIPPEIAPDWANEVQ
ncbi:hypothetical protein B0H17DRAFT_1216745 [Mycena rosella]|uniref:Uncharacterized protein n=1 Tax=Mycena rosella TaxID=1033263 RepID=A0AAD7C5Y1_MYCRO|nr:hypothetical protein B0H17DRAFT_1216745 [Mycena rosella]